ncbi:hypothetical protein O3P69_001504 [Scylla paramamosain]|uniref:Metallothionein n=1 Tax=Scylla paramamosain TaxID=85552 RepID=A0AAW0UYF7_SCYPA
MFPNSTVIAPIPECFTSRLDHILQCMPDNTFDEDAESLYLTPLQAVQANRLLQLLQAVAKVSNALRRGGIRIAHDTTSTAARARRRSIKIASCRDTSVSHPAELVKRESQVHSPSTVNMPDPCCNDKCDCKEGECKTGCKCTSCRCPPCEQCEYE